MLLKDLYNARFINQLAEICATEIEGFPTAKFKKQVFQPAFDGFELKQRSTHIAHVFRALLEEDFTNCSKQILQVVQKLKSSTHFESTLPFLFIPEVYEHYGLKHPKVSFQAFEHITSLITCEFAVRPFIVSNPEIAMRYIQKWSMHKNEHVRRLASEGIRPRLPWASELSQFRNNPAPVIEILENLKSDSSEYVRRSVANNLNDISKDHPNIVINLTKKWLGQNQDTDRLLKHANRTMLKAGNREILELFSYSTNGQIELKAFKLNNRKVTMGESLSWNFNLLNKANTSVKVRVEYVFYFLRNNGSFGAKVFKHTELQLNPGESQELVKNHKFIPITTRKYYSGKQQLAVIINGKASEAQEFELIC